MPTLDLPISILKDAVERVPSLKYAFGIAGLAATLSIVLSLSGKIENPTVPIALIFIGMILLFVFGFAVSHGIVGGGYIGAVLVWAVMLFFLVFLGFTIAAFAMGVPCNWAAFLAVERAASCRLQGGEEIKDKLGVLPEIPSTRVNSFRYHASDPGNPGPRYWQRIEDETWIETYPDGNTNIFKKIGWINYSGCDGSLLSLVGDDIFNVFVPAKGCPLMSLKFRRLPSNSWIGLSAMEEIK